MLGWKNNHCIFYEAPSHSMSRVTDQRSPCCYGHWISAAYSLACLLHYSTGRGKHMNPNAFDNYTNNTVEQRWFSLPYDSPFAHERDLLGFDCALCNGSKGCTWPRRDDRFCDELLEWFGRSVLVLLSNWPGYLTRWYRRRVFASSWPRCPYIVHFERNTDSCYSWCTRSNWCIESG